ncbi:MAG: DUF2848 domain-containing protein [Pseudomonadota bacterium]|nr:DUF2848 domain-containing protein [Pseudomonadota bacterium]
MNLEFVIEPAGLKKQIQIENLVVAGWTGRNVDALEEHIAELEKLGVPRPSSVPCFYRISIENFTNSDEIQVMGKTSSGEVEFILIGTDEGMLIGVGSDHTDRDVETYSVPVSKQMCPKPVSNAVWRYEDVAPHFDKLLLRAWVTENGHKSLYQDGGVNVMRSPEELIGLYLPGHDKLPPGTVMYCGTLAAIGGIRPGERFDVKIEDPVLNQSISYGYEINTLPVVT